MDARPNILVVLTDQLRYPPVYQSPELAQFCREQMAGQESLRDEGVSFTRHYPMSAACAPSRASLLTGQYPSLHGVTQTDGLAKGPEGPDMFWLAPDTVPTLGDWFRAAGYRTYFKGKWHASHEHLDAHDGNGYLLSIDDEGNPIEENIAEYLKADLLDDYGFSEWVGPEPHGLGKHNMGTVKDPFTADETIELLQRLDADEADEPWLTVCCFSITTPRSKGSLKDCARKWITRSSSAIWSPMPTGMSAGKRRTRMTRTCRPRQASSGYGPDVLPDRRNSTTWTLTRRLPSWSVCGGSFTNTVASASTTTTDRERART